MDEIRLAELADELEADWRHDEEEIPAVHFHAGISERDGELLTEELERRGVPMLVRPLDQRADAFLDRLFNRLQGETSP